MKIKSLDSKYNDFFSLLSSQLEVSSFTINLILITSATVVLASPTLFLLRSGKGKSAFKNTRKLFKKDETSYIIDFLIIQFQNIQYYQSLHFYA